MPEYKDGMDKFYERLGRIHYTLSRKYSEMKLNLIDAAGRAIREATKG